jgi:hypothetical protein
VEWKHHQGYISVGEWINGERDDGVQITPKFRDALLKRVSSSSSTTNKNTGGWVTSNGKSKKKLNGRQRKAALKAKQEQKIECLV